MALYVVDLGCGHCGRRAEAVLRALPGVVAATVRRLQERADVRYDPRRTSERELTSALAGAGFQVATARRSARAATAPGGLDVSIALVALANLLLLDAAAGPGALGPAVVLARIVLGALSLAACASALAGPALELLRRGILDRDALALLAALGSFVAGTVQLGLAGRRERLPAALEALGLRTGTWASERWGFVAAASIAASALVVRFAQAQVRRGARGRLAEDEGSTVARRLDARGRSHAVHPEALGEGDRVRLVEGERAPAGLHLEGAARSLVSAPSGTWTARGQAAGEVLPAGAVLLSAEATGRVQRGRPSLAAALDVELRAVLAHLAAMERSPTYGSWDDVAVRGIITAALGCASFALVTHGCFGAGPLGPVALSACLSVLVVASPSALLIAGPAARAIAVLRARAAGVVVKDAAALEALAAVDVICLQKNGTLTGDLPAMRRVVWAPGAGGVGPLEKALAIRDLQLGGARVLFVGDGWDDPRVAAQADLAVAIAPGTLPGALRAPIVVCRDRLDELPGLVELGRSLRAVLRQNVALAAVYNAVLIPAAALGYVSLPMAAGLSLAEALLGLANAARLLRAPAVSPKTA